MDRVMKIVGASNHCDDERQINDFYATDELDVLDFLLSLDRDGLILSNKIWEVSCGEGNISRVLESRGHNVRSSDLIDRGYGEKLDFLSIDKSDFWDGDILTNPPYKGNIDIKFVEKALDVVKGGKFVIMLFKTIFLASKKRYDLFSKYKPSYVYTHSKRIKIYKNNDRSGSTSNALDYSWFIWQKGVNGDFQNRLVEHRDWR